MKALTNPCAVSLPQEGMPGKGTVRRVSAKPLQQFAAAVAVAGQKERGKTEKNVPDKTVARTKTAGRQGTVDTAKRSDRSTPDEGPVVALVHLSDAPAEAPVPVKKPAVKADIISTPVFKAPSKESPAVKSHPKEVGEDANDLVAGRTSNAVAMVQHPSAHVTPRQSPADAVSAAIHTQGGAPEVGEKKAQIKTSQTVPGDAGSRPQKLQKDADPDKPAMTPSEQQGVGKKESVAVAAQPAESVEVSHVEKTMATMPPASAAASVTRPAPKADSSTVVPKPGQEVLKDVPVVRQNPMVAAPTTSGQNPSGPLPEGRPRIDSRPEGSPVRERRPAELAGPDNKKAQLVSHTEGANVPAEPPASTSSQTAVVGLRTSLETPVQGNPDSGTTPSPVRTVGEQILDSVRTSTAQGDRQISVHLRPPELGTVTVRLRDCGDHLEGTVEVGQSETRQEIERALPEVVRSLQEAGIPIRRFEVTSSESLGQDLGRGLPQQDQASGQHGSGQHREHFPAAHTPWMHETRDSTTHSEETAGAGRQSTASPGRIDMLL